MSTADTAAAPDPRPHDLPGNAEALTEAVHFPEGLKKAAWLISLFLLVFPPVAALATYVTDGVLLLSVPLLLMTICGGFGLRLSIHLERKS